MVQGSQLNNGSGDSQVDQMRSFALGSLNASSSVFYWIDDRMEMSGVELTGNCRQTFHLYEKQMKAFDPLNIVRLAGSNRRVSQLSDDYGLAPVSEYEHYRAYLKENRISDVLDFLFWDADMPFAGLGIIKHPGDDPFDDDTREQARLMQSYFEFNLSSHPRLRRQRLNVRLRKRYGLTKREIEITDLISLGMTNKDLAEQMAIGLGTVKTHVMRVFLKLGIENRSSLPARMDQIAAGEYAPMRA